MGVVQLIRTIRPAVHGLAAGAAALLVLKVLVLNEWPELFPGAKELGVAVEGVLASVLASYAFYIIVVHLKEQSDRSAVYPFIALKTQRVVSECRTQLAELSKASKVPLDLEHLESGSVEKAFAAINPKGPAPLVLMPGGQYASWMQYLLHFRRETLKHIEHVISKLVYVDAELVKLLVDVQDCPHFHYIETTGLIPFNNTDMTAWAPTFTDYCSKCRAVEKYFQRHLSPYGRPPAGG